MAAPFDYSRLVGTANRLISRFGRSATLTRAVRTPDVAKPWLSLQGDAAVAAAQSIAVQIVEPSKEWTHRVDETVREGAKIVFISVEAALPEELDTDWVLVDGGHSWVVLSIRPIKPGPTLIVYRVELEA